MNFKRTLRLGYDILLIVALNVFIWYLIYWFKTTIWHGSNWICFTVLAVCIIIGIPITIYAYTIGYRRYYYPDYETPPMFQTRITRKNIKTLLLLGGYYSLVIVPLLTAQYFFLIENNMSISIIFGILSGIMVVPACKRTNKVIIDQSKKKPEMNGNHHVEPEFRYLSKKRQIRIVFEITLLAILYLLSVYGVFYLAKYYLNDNLSIFFIVLLPYILFTGPICVYTYNLRYREIFHDAEGSDKELPPMARPGDVFQWLKVGLLLILANIPLFAGIYIIIVLRKVEWGVLIALPSAILSLLVLKKLWKVVTGLRKKNLSTFLVDKDDLKIVASLIIMWFLLIKYL